MLLQFDPWAGTGCLNSTYTCRRIRKYEEFAGIGCLIFLFQGTGEEELKSFIVSAFYWLLTILELVM